MKHVALIGASGFVGSAILEELLNRGHHVTAIVRTPNKLTQSHTNLKVEVMDVEDRNALVQVCHGQDAVISAYNPGWGNPDIYEDTLRVYPLILEAVKASGVKRFLVVGGAGSLFVKPGLRLVDAGTLPEAWLPGVKSLSKFFLDNKINGDTNGTISDADGAYEIALPDGGIDLLFSYIGYENEQLPLILRKGDSFISVEDYAMAMVDELEQENHHRERFTIGY